MFFALSRNLIYKWLQTDLFLVILKALDSVFAVNGEGRNKDKTKKQPTEQADT
jgi:hypothetical protein